MLYVIIDSSVGIGFMWFGLVHGNKMLMDTDDTPSRGYSLPCYMFQGPLKITPEHLPLFPMDP